MPFLNFMLCVTTDDNLTDPQTVAGRLQAALVKGGAQHSVLNFSITHATKPAVVSTGNPFDGMTLTGPFPSRSDAVNFAVEHLHNEDWTVSDLYAPKEN